MGAIDSGIVDQHADAAAADRQPVDADRAIGAQPVDAGEPRGLAVLQVERRVEPDGAHVVHRQQRLHLRGRCKRAGDGQRAHGHAGQPEGGQALPLRVRGGAVLVEADDDLDRLARSEQRQHCFEVGVQAPGLGEERRGEDGDGEQAGAQVTGGWHGGGLSWRRGHARQRVSARRRPPSVSLPTTAGGMYPVRRRVVSPAGRAGARSGPVRRYCARRPWQ